MKKIYIIITIAISTGLLTSCSSKMTKENVAKDICKFLEPKVSDVSKSTQDFIEKCLQNEKPGKYMQEQLDAVANINFDAFDRLRAEILPLVKKGEGSLIYNCMGSVYDKYDKSLNLKDTAFLSQVVAQMRKDGCNFPAALVDFSNRVR